VVQTVFVISSLISVVIPTLNEAARIERCLEQFRHQAGAWELIVADGGSTDGTERLAACAGAQLVHGHSGRGPQQNAGAAVARGEVLLFLHADAILPNGAHQRIFDVLQETEILWGAFRVFHEAERWKGSWRRKLLRFADLRSRYTKRPYGDQGIFVRRVVFSQSGGFSDQPLMEELALTRRLHRLGRFAQVPSEIRVSGRRFEASPLRAFLCMNSFPLLLRLGVSPSTLAWLYGNPR
jgi:uncharacterized protein